MDMSRRQVVSQRLQAQGSAAEVRGWSCPCSRSGWAFAAGAVALPYFNMQTLARHAALTHMSLGSPNCSEP